ncbi:MAG: hypothetical protein RHS_5211 [Robinsoniella sp. RHS]|nr:MAG: hypothetical protein RHS_5211 [Robinsoniella sp. RHS]
MFFCIDAFLFVNFFITGNPPFPFFYGLRKRVPLYAIQRLLFLNHMQQLI